MLPGLEETAHAHGPRVRGFGGDAFVEFSAPFAAHAVVGAGEVGEDGVAGAVGEERSLHGDPRLGGELPGAHGLHVVGCRRAGVDAGAEDEGQIGLVLGVAIENGVPHRVVWRLVVVVVVEHQLLDDAGLPPVFAVGAADVHADLAGGVAAEDRAVLDESDLGAVAGGGEGGGETGEASADDAEINRNHLFFHGMSCLGVSSRDCVSLGESFLRSS